MARLYDGTPNMGCKRFDTKRSEVENLVCMYTRSSAGCSPNPVLFWWVVVYAKSAVHDTDHTYISDQHEEAY